MWSILILWRVTTMRLLPYDNKKKKSMVNDQWVGLLKFNIHSSFQVQSICREYLTMTTCLQVKNDEDRKWTWLIKVQESYCSCTLKLCWVGGLVLRHGDWQSLMGRFKMMDTSDINKKQWRQVDDRWFPLCNSQAIIYSNTVKPVGSVRKY